MRKAIAAAVRTGRHEEKEKGMASVYVMTEPPTDIDYSLVDGRVRRFFLFGQKMYDEDDGTSIDGWRDRLVEFVRIQGLDVDKDGHGLHAFVYKMQDDGLLPNAKVSGAGPASFSTDGLAEIEAEETELKRMAESGYMLSDTDYCCDVVCREHAVRMLRGLLSANVEIKGGEAVPLDCRVSRRTTRTDFYKEMNMEPKCDISGPTSTPEIALDNAVIRAELANNLRRIKTGSYTEDHGSHFKHFSVAGVAHVAAAALERATTHEQQLKGECLMLADVLRDAYEVVKTIEGEDSDECDKLQDLRMSMEYALAMYDERRIETANV